jgi:hypothetical protein
VAGGLGFGCACIGEDVGNLFVAGLWSGESGAFTSKILCAGAF